MSLIRWNSLGLVSLAVVAWACGGPPAVTPTSPTPSPKSSAAPATSGSAAAASPQTAAPLFDVDIVPTRISPAPKTMPKVGIEVPSPEQFLPATFLSNKDYKMRAAVRGWEGLAEGSYLQLILDNYPAPPVTDPKAAVKLLGLTPDGNLAEGEHVIAAFMCRANHESYKGPDGAAVNRFWAVKNKGKEFKGNAPMLILNRPYGTYKGAAVDDMLIDFYVLNVLLGDKDNYVHITLTGPGIKQEGLSRNITEWRPYSIVSPHNGEYTITAELMDKNGNLIAGGWNSTTRKFTVDK